MSKIILELDPDQAAVIAQACEALARIGMGQFGAAIVDNTAHMPHHEKHQHAARDVLGVLTETLGSPRYSRSGGPSITNTEVPNQHRTAWDICQVLRQQLNKAGDPRFQGAVDSRDPLRCGDGDLPKVEVKS